MNEVNGLHSIFVASKECQQPRLVAKLKRGWSLRQQCSGLR